MSALLFMLNPLRRFALGALFLGFLSLFPASGMAYIIIGPTWTTGSTVQMRLSLGTTNANLQDGHFSWNASAADALAAWNSYTDIVKVSSVSQPASAGLSSDGVNNAFFSSKVYGSNFGNGVLAVTIRWVKNPENWIMRESDVVFNNAVAFNSFSGPRQWDPVKHVWIYDLNRVAIHEFGHVLGLDHPDQYGQNVESIMNSVISDLNHIADDDVTGVKTMYGATITSSLSPPSGELGSAFLYQITANNNATSFGATGLPAGLQVDSSTGQISGTPTESGIFPVTLTALGLGTATINLQLVINGPMITSNLVPKTIEPGVLFNYQIAASYNPTSFDASGLPPGLQLDTATGLISGTPSTPGSYSVTLIAHTSVADAHATLPLTVNPPHLQFFTPGPTNIGSQFWNQISANVPVLSYSVTGLPPGLQVDQQTGVITGAPTLSGTFQVTFVAHTAYGDATGSYTLTIQPLPNDDIPIASFSIVSTYGLIADPVRPRAYVAMYNGIGVIDLETMSMIKTLPVGIAMDMCLSTDGSKLWFVRYYDYTIGSIDLNTLSSLPDITTTVHPGSIRAGVTGRLYVTSAETGPWQIYQINPTTGLVESHFVPAPPNSGSVSYQVDASADGKALFVGASGDGTNPSARYDITGATPSITSTMVQGGYGCNGVVASLDGARVFFVPFSPSAPYGIQERSGANIASVIGNFPCSSRPGVVAFNSTGTSAFQGFEQIPEVDVFDTQTFALQRTIHLSNTSGTKRLAVDNTNSYLLAAVNGDNLQVYRLKPAPDNSPPKILKNVSTRTFVLSGENVEIGGFIIQGDQPKKVVVRAVGPSLAQYGLPALSDPVLELHDATGAVIAANDNWNSHRQDVLASGLAPSDEHEAVMVTTLVPGGYTAVLRGLNGAVGTAVFELYDADPASSRIANLSTRAKVGTGNDVMIGGFIVGGGQPTSVIVRAIGPSLTPLGVSGALADTTLELRDGSGNLVAQNDEWESDQKQAIIDSGVAPTDPHESAIVATLAPGGYTAIVRGKNDSTGVALVEIYNLEPN